MFPFTPHTTFRPRVTRAVFSFLVIQLKMGLNSDRSEEFFSRLDRQVTNEIDLMA